MSAERPTKAFFTRAVAWVMAVSLLLAGCGGGSDRTKAQVRLVNASTGYTQLELRVDDQLRESGIGYGASASYVEASPGKVFSIGSPSSPTSLLSFTPEVSARKYYTVLAYGPAGLLKQAVLDDNQGQPDSNRALLRVVNAAPDAGSLDVYLTAATDALAQSVAFQAGAAVDGVGSFSTVNSGTWRLRVTGAGDKSDLRLDVPALTLDSREVATLVIVPAPGGVLVQSLLLSQQGGIDAQAATQARVRVATALPNVAVVLGATPLLQGGAAAFVVNPYSVLAAGTQSLVVTVGSATLPSSVQQLTPGSDYTLLVHGTALSPLVSLIADDNHLPDDRTKAKVRLVNGVGGLSGGLSMTINNSLQWVNVAAGQASAYAPQAPTITAQITASAGGVGTPFSTSAQTQTFIAGSIYSFFVMGEAASASGALQTDR